MEDMKRWLNIIVLLSLLFGLLTVSVSADEEETSNFINITDQELMEKVKTNVAIKVKTAQGKECAFSGFVIRDDGWFALFRDGLVNKEVNVYNDVGIWQYGFTLTDSGGINTDWSGDHIRVILERSSMAITVSSTGEILQYEEVIATWKVNPLKDAGSFHKMTVGNKEYKMKNDMGFLLNIFTTHYSQIIETDQNGNTRLIYDINNQVLKNRLIMLAIVLPIVVGIVFYFVLTIRERCRSGYYEETRKQWKFR